VIYDGAFFVMIFFMFEHANIFFSLVVVYTQGVKQQVMFTSPQNVKQND